jgi:aminomethyltransferase
MAAGKPEGITPTGPSDIRRIEAGILNYGVDMTLENNPYEVGLERLVELNKKGDFIGKEALKRIQSAGVKRKLVGIEIDDAPLDLNLARWPVSRDGKQVGHVTSAVFSPRLKKNIGYAMLPVDCAGFGTVLAVTIPDVGERRAAVVKKPFLDPQKNIPKT